MIINLISYSLDQGHYNFTLKEIEKNLLDLNQDGKKYIIYYSDIFYSGSLRNKEEYKIQLSVSIKHKLIGYAAEEYEIIIIGYDRTRASIKMKSRPTIISVNRRLVSSSSSIK